MGSHTFESKIIIRHIEPNNIYPNSKEVVRIIFEEMKFDESLTYKVCNYGERDRFIKDCLIQIAEKFCKDR